jgi:hypothetical protein
MVNRPLEVFGAWVRVGGRICAGKTLWMRLAFPHVLLGPVKHVATQEKILDTTDTDDTRRRRESRREPREAAPSSA